MSTSLVSVIMNCYNSEKYLKEAIDSVFAQTYQNFEIIFWDNKSIDSSADIAKSFGEKVRYFQSEENVPLGHARNFALSKANGEFVAFLDCDDIWFPQKLERQLAAFKDPEVGIVSSDAMIFSDAKDIRTWFSDRKIHNGYCFTELFQNYFLCMPTIVVRRSLLDKLDYWFDNRFSLIEEADFLTRLALVSKLTVVDDVLAKWRVHPNSWTWKKFASFPDERQLMLETYERNIPDFSSRYSREIETFNDGIKFSRAKNFWIAGNGEEARKLISADIAKNKKNFLLYALSFFPFNAVNSAMNFWGYGKMY